MCAAELGDLDKVKRVVKLVGFVNCSSGFTEQPKVINGCSDFLKQVCLCPRHRASLKSTTEDVCTVSRVSLSHTLNADMCT
jgi:hypothetical protein